MLVFRLSNIAPVLQVLSIVLDVASIRLHVEVVERGKAVLSHKIAVVRYIAGQEA